VSTRHHEVSTDDYPPVWSRDHSTIVSRPDLDQGILREAFMNEREQSMLANFAD